MLSDAVSGELRPSAQGLSDLTMGLAGASAGAISGVIVEAWGYPTLTLLAALATAPLIALLLGQGRTAGSPTSACLPSAE
jgi:predicted MFS family arabinose efflux permease